MMRCECGYNLPALPTTGTGPGASLGAPCTTGDPKLCSTCGDLVANCTGSDEEQEEDTMPDNAPRLRTCLARRPSRIAVGLLVTLGLLDLVFIVFCVLHGHWILALLG